MYKRRLALCFALAFVLVAIGDQYPFSPFPMYAKLEPEADVLYVADELGQPLPMAKLFNVGSAQGKKRFEKELLDVAKTRDYERVPADKVEEAARRFLAALWKDRKTWRTDSLTIKGLKAQIITISVDAEAQFVRREQTLGTYPLPL